MNEDERCNTTLGLGLGIGSMIKRDKELKKNKTGFWLDLALPIHPKIEARDHDYDYDEEIIDDRDSLSSKTIDDHEEEEERLRLKRRVNYNVDAYNNNIDGSRKKLKLTTEQTMVLEDNFKIHNTLNTGQKQELAKKLNLLPRQIEVWFQNRRARTKLKHIEQECELLKKCCQTLRDENHRLKKELQEVRCYCSLKYSDHHHHHQPPQNNFYIRYATAMTAIHHHPWPEKISGKSGDEDDMKRRIGVTKGGTMDHMDDNSNKENATL